MWIDPTFEKATSLHEWSLLPKKTHPDITLLLTWHIKTAKTLTIGDIACGLFDNELKYCKLNATIKKIINPNDPYYASCTKCYKKVEHVDPKCPRCLTEKSDYEDRFLLKLDVFTEVANCTIADCTETDSTAHYTEADRCTVTLFEAARYLIGCDVKSYNEEFPFYRSLVLSRSKEYTFLIKLDTKNVRDRTARCFIAEEVQEVKKSIAVKIFTVVDILDEEPASETTIKKSHKDKAHEDATADPIATKRVKLEKDS
ncbi:hypothetical protein P3L10_005472 [Capsicum annuum]